MTSRRDFAVAAGSLGIGAALGSVARLGHAAPPEPGLDPGADPAAAAPDRGTPDWVSIRDTGAVGDGQTDDTDAIQRAFDGRTAGVTYLPGGAYVVSRTIRVPKPVSIVGDGGRTTYLLSRITDGSPVLDIGQPDYSERLRGVRLSGFTIRGEGPGRLGSGGLRLHAFYDAVVDSVRIESLGWGLDCNRAIGVQFDNLLVNGMRDDGGQPGEGIYLYGQTNACLFNNLRASDHSGAALRLGYGQSLTLVAPVIESTRSAAIVIGQERGGRFVNCRGVTILNPYFEKNRPHDMHFLRGTPPTIIGGYWGPLHADYVAPILSQLPVTAVGCDFPAAPGGAMRVGRNNATALFLGCTFAGEVATFAQPAFRESARLRVLGADGDERVGGSDGEE